MISHLLADRLPALVFCCLTFAPQVNSQSLNSLEVSLEGPAKFIVTDPLQRKTGVDPIKLQTYSDIPGATYGTGGAGSEDPNISAVVTEEFGYPNPLNGTYTMQSIGMKLGRFELFIILYREAGAGRDFKLTGVIDHGQEITYSFNYDSDTSKSLSASKVVTSSSLRQDLDNCYKLKLLGQRELYFDLSRRADKIEKYLSREDSLKARQELLKLKEKIEDVYKKTEKSVDKKKPMKRDFISEDAFKILDEDIRSLLEQLPEHRKGKGWEREKEDEKDGKGREKDRDRGNQRD